MPPGHQEGPQCQLISGSLAGGALEIAVPAATLPVAAVNAGVDKVCADPERFAADVSTEEWLLKNLPRKSPS
jgi:hypothetical protein